MRVVKYLGEDPHFIEFSSKKPTRFFILKRQAKPNKQTNPKPINKETKLSVSSGEVQKRKKKLETSPENSPKQRSTY